MSFWPFGRDPADVEIAARVITAATQNGVKVRGKLTIHFEKPQTQADADEAAERVATVAIALLREAPEHQRLIGAETQLSAQILGRYPHGIAAARAVELAALHVVGDPTLTDELRRASTTGPMAPIVATTPAVPRSTPPPRSVPPPSIPPPSTGPALAPPPAPMRRRGSSQIRSIQSLLMPPGTSPAAMGSFIAPLVRDSAARLLIGFLRAHDLVTLRGVVIDASSAEMLANLVPISDAPPGGYEASRASEIARWQATLGADVVAGLLKEAGAVSVHIARDAMSRAEVSRPLATAVTESICATGFPEDEMLQEIDRFPAPGSPELAEVVAQNLTIIGSAGDDPAAMTAALRPLLGYLRDDLDVAAMIIKMSSG